jgi:uncharacterized protein with PQ loop repeat
MAQSYVIVGASLAGATAAITLREEGADGTVILIGAEQAPPYERPPLSKAYLRGEVPFDKAKALTCAHCTQVRKTQSVREGHMTTSQIFGFLGTGFVIAGYIPQIAHLVKEHCTAGISIPAFVLWCVASFLFLIHAAVIRDPVFVGVQTVNLVAGGLIVGFCKRYEGVCPFHRKAYSQSISKQ